ncbi:alpha/beta hydrolase [uncultured Desulfobacter sp.]|uniref:alpha/beta fold hydrolase n=1 Tax=uncultured Desulfobacter sp. TaxID=240139 RepID=UPI002AABDF3F|nr:alpha/beta hydrolase [uncultured Desulfobacter sp.]
MGNTRIRIYGDKGPPVMVLHGGPGAPGSAAPVAAGLAGDFRVFEPYQRAGAETPLSVAVHIFDLHGVISARCGGQRPALVGESWGAMLALAYAAQYPETVGPLVLIGCGTFDTACREEMIRIRKRRISDYIKNHPEHSPDLYLPFQEQIMKWHEMTDNFHCEADANDNLEAEPFDMRAHTETWNDMIRCQEKGIYPQTFTNINLPVIMLHGSYDPHPGKMIRDQLKLYIPQLEYHEFEKCGHSPSKEIYAKDDFFQVMRSWLREALGKLHA